MASGYLFSRIRICPRVFLASRKVGRISRARRAYFSASGRRQSESVRPSLPEQKKRWMVEAK
jgi:hypothetical protein